MMKHNLIEDWMNRGIIRDEKLIDAFLSIPREEFILKKYLNESYGDYPLPIGYEQTISQPTTVMLMIEALELKKNDRVLEIGAGSGYCAAIISKLAKEVITTEIVPELAKFAKDNLKKANINNVNVIESDGSQGYEKEAPYDKIMFTAACPKIPEHLAPQLKNNGIILAPVGDFFGQKMIKCVKKNNNLDCISLGYFTFVPLKGKFGFK